MKYFIALSVDINYSEIENDLLQASLKYALKLKDHENNINFKNGADLNENIPDRISETKPLLMSCIEMEHIELAILLMKRHAQITYYYQNNYFILIEMYENNILKHVIY
ncbi:hypothetical protein H8356DRAFT_1081442 [Neocallimastix lanati (nom. inval.)]|uniref:Uncharacterized protein n=1 Tax=Neocallimastix californiae TaxID=1754190 RepID=A0A1Y2CD86_9FUNG|nr:hypothetical protein H8356DRAFT_1081442 [Neocallimastix sp. JGI-2020a]ORY44993.1 hypothetical protein LY90DRAFT_509551 [Neocallimastix californiae]|eukprot:ORY44993.1 hypothetical protein LY90DRAFT_509551 [Neocallimastix californiae]